MGALFLGQTNMKDSTIMLGSQPVDALFLGRDQLWPPTVGTAVGIMRYPDADYRIILAPKTSEVMLRWKTTNTLTGGVDSPYDGWTNSELTNDALHPAAQYCRAYNAGGLYDWYLPSWDELELCYRILKPTFDANVTSGLGGANDNSVPPGPKYTIDTPTQTTHPAFKQGGKEAFEASWYFSSSEVYAASSRALNFGTGATVASGKTTSRLIRPIRRVKIVT